MASIGRGSRQFQNLAAIVAGLTILWGVPAAHAADDADPPAKVEDYTSPNFLVHTDLSADEAEELLGRLETMLGLISTYWRQPLRNGPIECYVVKDLQNWPKDRITSPIGLQQIAAKAGVTVTGPDDRGVLRSVVYAFADRGTPQHEAVHAYCGQTFGTTGPVWYSEGMAELGQYWREGEKAVQCHPEVVEYIHRSPPKSLNGIVNGNEATGDSWENYAWRWALCHLLANHPDYQEAFHALGLSILARGPTTFEQALGARADAISFEYLFFLQHFDQGYRVDLCRWNLNAAARLIPRRGQRIATTKAGLGWQPSGILLLANKEYQFSAKGAWQTAADAESVTADGDAEGIGRLVGVVLSDPAVAGGLPDLSEPFDLGSYGTFTAPAAGSLYLRCQDGWGQIADNEGTIKVKIKLHGQGNPLPMPAPAE